MVVQTTTKKSQLDYNSLNLLLQVTKNLKQWKWMNGHRTADRLDFTDMVKKFIDDGLVVPFKVLMVDEAQDLTPCSGTW